MKVLAVTAMPLLSKLEENTLFRARSLDEFTARDICDMVLLYMVTLHILRTEFETAPFAQNYAKRTMSHNGFDKADPYNTDLYQLLHMVSHPHDGMAAKLDKPHANDLLWHDTHFAPANTKRLLLQIANSGYDGHDARRLLLSLEQQLKISNSNYRSVRRLASEWGTSELDTEQQKLTITRLLQAFRSRVRRGDLAASLENLARHHKYEMHDVINAETGETPRAAQSGKSGMTFLKGLAIAAGIAAADRVLQKARL